MDFLKFVVYYAIFCASVMSLGYVICHYKDPYSGEINFQFRENKKKRAKKILEEEEKQAEEERRAQEIQMGTQRIEKRLRRVMKLRSRRNSVQAAPQKIVVKVQPPSDPSRYYPFD